MTEEERDEGKVSWRVYWAYARDGGVLLTALTVLAVCGGQAMSQLQQVRPLAPPAPALRLAAPGRAASSLGAARGFLCGAWTVGGVCSWVVGYGERARACPWPVTDSCHKLHRTQWQQQPGAWLRESKDFCTRDGAQGIPHH